MPVYVWVAETKRGRKLKGEIDAANEAIALNQLKKRNFSIKKLKPKPKDIFENISFLKPKVTNKDLVVFTRQFSTMIDAGLPLVQGLTILAEQSENPTFKSILKEITKDVEGGSTLAEAMKKHGKVFDDLFVNLVAAGEVGGILDTILRRLATFIEKAEKLKSKIKGAMTYPAVVVAIAIIVIAVILIFVIPVFEDMFKSFGSALPGPTQVVVNMSRFMKGNFHWVILGAGALVYGFQEIPGHAERKKTDGCSFPEIAHLRGPSQENGGSEIYKNPWHHDQQRRAYPGCSGDRGKDLRQRDYRGNPLRSEGEHCRGANHCRASL
jgi:type IV pilus assembly protein PilC